MASHDGGSTAGDRSAEVGPAAAVLVDGDGPDHRCGTGTRKREPGFAGHGKCLSSLYKPRFYSIHQDASATACSSYSLSLIVNSPLCGDELCYVFNVTNPIRNSERVHSISNGAGFWADLPKPILALAPLEDVTDAAFRRIIAQRGKPDVTFCEFTSADGLALADEMGQKKLRRKLLFSEIERPVVAQFFTAVPKHMEYAAKLAAEMGFDGVDINMGCPDRAVEKAGCGAAMIKNPQIAREIIRAAQRGWLQGASSYPRGLTSWVESKVPVSVKTRLGYNADQLEEWLPELLREEPAAITIHARTRTEMSLVPARWERVRRAVEIRDQYQGPALTSRTLIIGNGDLEDIDDARAKVAESGADGAMLGRAIFGNPWLFQCSQEHGNRKPTPRERMETLVEHIKLFDDLLGDVQNFGVMKKHFRAYISGWDGARGLRVRLMETYNPRSALNVLEE